MTFNPLAGEILIWFSIFFCISQSAIFSGLNLAVFSLSRLRLEVARRQWQRGCSQRSRSAQGLQFDTIHDYLGERPQ
jgi:CBS domain containing-hemolysin-like protein